MRKTKQAANIEVRFTEKAAWEDFAARLKERVERLVRQGKAKRIK